MWFFRAAYRCCCSERVRAFKALSRVKGALQGKMSHPVSQAGKRALLAARRLYFFPSRSPCAKGRGWGVIFYGSGRAREAACLRRRGRGGRIPRGAAGHGARCTRRVEGRLRWCRCNTRRRLVRASGGHPKQPAVTPVVTLGDVKAGRAVIQSTFAWVFVAFQVRCHN